MSRTSREDFTRVIAVAVQGIMNAQPQRSFTLPTFLYYIRLDVFEWHDDIAAASLSLRDRLRKSVEEEPVFMEFLPGTEQTEGAIVRFHWAIRKYQDRAPDLIENASQSDVEKVCASFFAHPYPVTHVSGKAQRFAKEFVEQSDSLAYMFTRRWLP